MATKITGLIVRRWFQASLGNTYHTVEFERAEGPPIKSTMSYGYDEMWKETAKSLANVHGFTLPTLDAEHVAVYDVKRKKDL